jgi:transposase
MTRYYVEPETLSATCPVCGHECELGIGHPKDVCDHFDDFVDGKFFFDSENE